MGKLIVIDGIDGVGKSTQVGLLKEWLESRGRKVVQIHFPRYHSDASYTVRELLNGKLKDVPPIAIATFYINDFIHSWLTEIKPYLDDDYTVILDRFWTTTVIYEGLLYDPESPKYAVEHIKDWVEECGLPKDFTLVWLDGKFDVLMENKKKLLLEEGKEPDYFEKQQDFLKRFAELGLELYCSERSPNVPDNWHIVHVTDEEKMRDPKEILAAIAQLV